MSISVYNEAGRVAQFVMDFQYELGKHGFVVTRPWIVYLNQEWVIKKNGWFFNTTVAWVWVGQYAVYLQVQAPYWPSLQKALSKLDSAWKIEVVVK